jgi:hypothetical protein
MRRISIFWAMVLVAGVAWAHQAASGAPFGPFEKWRAAVLAGDSAALTALYSQSPAPQLQTADKKPISVADDVAFWAGLKAQGLTNVSAQIVQQADQSADLHGLVVQLTLTMKEGAATKKQYIAMAQTWYRAEGQWHLVGAQHTAATRLKQPLENKDIYPQNVDAKQEIAESLREAAAGHKRVLLVFGGNWCFDCHVLDEAFHSPEIAPTLNKSFVVAHIDIGQMDKNLDIAQKYEVPVEHGVPVLAVLDSSGKLVYSQKQHEFSAAHRMAPEDILAFLNKWKPVAGRAAGTSR